MLVEQHYGKGKSDLAGADRPMSLELSRQRDVIAVRVMQTDDPAAGHDWPAWVVDGAALPATVHRRNVDTTAGVIEAHYEVRPSPGDDVVLDVTETYRLVDDGTALAGTVDVKFMSEGKQKGGYKLTRRFERTAREAGHGQR